MVELDNLEVKFSTCGRQVAKSISPETLHARNGFSVIGDPSVDRFKVTDSQEYNRAFVTADGYQLEF